MAKNKTHQLLLTLTAVWLGFSFFVADASATTLGINGDKFTVDGQAKFLVLISYFDALDAQNLIADLDYLKSKGIDGIRILPNWWAGGQGGNYSNTALIDSSGNIRANELNKLKNIITQANNRGMIVDVSFTKETVQNLSTANYKTGVESAVNSLKNYTNIFYDFQNEANCNNFTEQDASSLRQMIKNIGPNILVSTSLACSISPAGTVSFTKNTAMDLVNHHEDRVSNWWNLTQNITQSLLAAGKPVYLGEPDRFRSGMTSTNFITAVSGAKGGGAAAWTFHTNAGFDLDGSQFQPKLNSTETDFLNKFQQALTGVTWGGGGPQPPSEGGGVTGPQGICPAGYIELTGANASGADPTATSGYFCDNDPVVATGVTYPVSGFLYCNASSGVAFYASDKAGDCNFRDGIRSGWSFDSNGQPIGVNISAQVSCPGRLNVTVNNSAITGGAWTTSPSTEGVVCIPGISSGSNGNPPVPPPEPPSGPPPVPPTITGINPTTGVPGQTIEIYGTNLSDKIKLVASNGTSIEVVSSVDNQLFTTATLEVPLDIAPGTYQITVTNTIGSVTSTQSLTVNVGGQPFSNSVTPTIPTQGLPTDLGQLIQQIFTWSLASLGIAVFVMFFYAGFLWLTAAGNTAKVSEAKSIMTNAVFGAIILLSAYLILYTINPDFVKSSVKLPGLDKYLIQ